jgi:hemolysin III
MVKFYILRIGWIGGMGMNERINAQHYSMGEEIANCIIHGVGVLLSIAGLVILVVVASILGDAWHIVSSSVYGATLVLLYTASTLYHGIPSPRAKELLKVIDHSAIYLLIAGTYTPYTLVNLRGPWGWSLFGIIWGLAALGIILKVIRPKKWVAASLVLYVGMGWAVVLAIKPLLAVLAPGGMLLLVLGGLSYTLGVVFYVWSRLPYNHAIWHVFVLSGSVFHFFSILFYVIPVGASPGR